MPEPLEGVLSVVLPHGQVEEDATYDVELPSLSADDRQDDEDIYAMERQVVVAIEDFDDAIDIIAELPETGSLELIGTFVLDETDRAAIMAVVDAWVASGRNCGFVLLDLETGAGLYCNIDHPFFSASTIKAPNLIALAYYRPEALDTYASDIRLALVNSNNEAYERVFNAYPDSIPNQWRVRAHLGNQQFGRMYTYYTVRELAQLWCVNWDFLTQDTDAAQTLGEWLSSSLHSCFAAEFGGLNGYTVRSKAGWSPAENLACSEGGYVVTPDGTYLLCIMTDRPGYPDEILAPLVRALDDAYRAYVPRKVRK